MSILNLSTKKFVYTTAGVLPKTFITSATKYAASKKTSAAGDSIISLGKSKKNLGKLGTMEKKVIPVETNPNKLMNYVCGSNVCLEGEDIKLKPDSEYPAWLWELTTGPAPGLEDLDPNTKEFWLRVRTEGLRRNNRLKKLSKF